MSDGWLLAAAALGLLAWMISTQIRLDRLEKKAGEIRPNE